MRIRHTGAAAGAVLSLFTLTAAASEGAVKYRQHAMKAVGGHMQAIVSVIRGEVSHTDHLPTHADALADLAELTPTLFATGTEGGDTLPAVWEKAEDFQAKLGAFKEASRNLKTAVDAGEDPSGALRSVGMACKGCHDDYRAE